MIPNISPFKAFVRILFQSYIIQNLRRLTKGRFQGSGSKCRFECLTLIGKCPGYELDRFMENTSNQNLWLLIHYCSNSGHELDRSLENSSNSQFSNYGAWHGPISGKLIQIWTSFPEIGLAHADFVQKLNRYSPKIDGWIFQKSVQLMPRKLKFRKNTGWVFQKSVRVTPRRTRISGKFVDEFSRICQ